MHFKNFKADAMKVEKQEDLINSVITATRSVLRNTEMDNDYNDFSSCGDLPSY
jgi:hypothetical protein